MATHPDPDDLTPDAARETLAMLDGDTADLARRVVTPTYYHPVSGAALAAVIVAVAFGGAVAAAVICLALAAVVVLVVGYQRSTGISVSGPSGRRAGRMLLALAAVIVLAFLTSVIVSRELGCSPWWSLLPAAVVWAAMILMGRRYDSLLREEMAAPSSAAS